MNKLFLGFPFIYILLSCSIQNKIGITHNSGKLSCVKRIYDSSTKQLIIPDYMTDPNIWYKDSLIISEVFRTEIDSDVSTGKESWKSVPFECTFINIATRSFYVFSSFSDTAKLIRKYYQPDSVQGTVWNFWGIHPKFSFKKSQPINDTVVDGISYKRFRKIRYFNNESNQVDSVYDVAYMRCNTNKPKMFTYDKPFSEQHGCPIVRYDAYGIGQPYVVSQILFLADTLTPKEEMVFKVWAKYAKEHPVER